MSFYFFKCCTSHDNLPTSLKEGGNALRAAGDPAALHVLTYSFFISSGRTGSKATPYQWSGSCRVYSMHCTT